MITASAPGKINIFFACGALQPDGFHEVASVYLALNLRERVSVSLSQTWAVTVQGEISAEHLAGVPTDESNLVVRAAKLVAKIAKIDAPTPLHFVIDKAVPVAGGMGGGSADAAAAMVAANEIWLAGLSFETLVAESGRLGADVPFALAGEVAVGLGRGEQLRSIHATKPLHWVLVANDGGLSTPTVYRHLDELRSAQQVDPTKVSAPSVPALLEQAIMNGDAHALAGLMRNDLEAAAVDLMPTLAQTIEAGVAAGALAGMVSGSGPTVALLAESENSAESIANYLAIQGYTAITAVGPAAGTILESN